MQRCIDLATLAEGNTSPNPMVGAVIVHEGRVIGEGYHSEAGKPHAEVMAVKSVSENDLYKLKSSVLYVNLEPCCHHGKTPPCTDLILKHQIPHVVTGSLDPNPQVAGKGLQLLQSQGIKVTTGVLEQACKVLNKRFFCLHKKKRPYITLKWAQTANGFFAPLDTSQKWITSSQANLITHYWRSKEDAILIGTNTALQDNPELNVRHVEGKNPIRIVIDENLSLPGDLKLFSGSQPTIIVNAKKNAEYGHLTFLKLNFDGQFLSNLMHALYKAHLQSIIIEGGVFTLKKFIEAGFWDEAKIWTAHQNWENGIPAPVIDSATEMVYDTGQDILSIVKNENKVKRSGE